MLDLIWDMETNDPDDFLTLLLLLGHPAVDLKAVTITPGTPQQVGLVRWALSQFSKDIPVGAGDLDHPKECVSEWHYKAYGEIAPSRQAEPAAEVLLRCCGENVTLLTGGPIKNVGAALQSETFQVGRMVIQGGFAGEGVVPPDIQMEKFRGLTTCPTFNLNGDKKAARRMLDSNQIGLRRFVSKNVCHRIIYDARLHERVTALRGHSLALDLIWQGMDHYLRHRPDGKMLHDPFAACCAIDESIATWAEVELFSEHGGWGSRPATDSRTWITVDYDHEAFLRVLTAY